jgi:hypothetical protein
VTEAHDEGWRATVDGAELERTHAGWANGFELSDGDEGRVVVSYPRPLGHWVWLLVMALVWIVVLGGAFSRTRTKPGRVT